MASATYLQSLDATYEDGTSRGVTPSNRRQTEIYLAAETLAIGDVVTFDYANADDGKKTLYVRKASKAAAKRNAIGVVLEAANSAGLFTENEPIRVVIGGIATAQVEGKDASGNSPIAVGDLLTAGNVDGVFMFKSGPTELPSAIALETAAGGAGAALKKVLILRNT